MKDYELSLPQALKVQFLIRLTFDRILCCGADTGGQEEEGIAG